MDGRRIIMRVPTEAKAFILRRSFATTIEPTPRPILEYGGGSFPGVMQ
jgi:hypothetical protein